MSELLPNNRQYRKIFTIRMPLCLAEIYMPTHCFGTGKLIGRGIHNIVFEIREGIITGFFSEEDIEKVGQCGLVKLLNKKFVDLIKIKSFISSQKLVDSSNYINSINLVNLSSLELAELYRSQIKLIRVTYGYFNLSSPAISKALEEEIDRLFDIEKLSKTKITKIKEIFLFGQKKTIIDEEECELRKIAYKIKSNKKLTEIFLKKDFKEIIIALNKSFPKFHSLLVIHSEKYSYLQGYVDFHSFDKTYYIYRLKDLLIKTPIEIDIGKLKCLKRDLPVKSKKLLYLLNISNYLSYHRMQMRIHFTKGLVTLKLVLDEIARRMDISTENVKQVSISENIQFLRNKKLPDLDRLKKRKQYCIYIIEDKKTRLLVGDNAKKYKNVYLLEKELKNVSFIRGIIANPGIVQGYAKIIMDEVDLVNSMKNMQKGSILVTHNTRPDMILACRKAAAIITEEGGILSHAALVSREFNIPCIVNAKDSTKIFKDGDFVEVNAVEGFARKFN